MKSQQKIAIVGTGYVGLTCALGFAEFGHPVVGFDILPERIRDLNLGIPPYREAGLSDALARQLAARRLRFVESLAEAVGAADIVILAVGTPSRPDGSCDTSALESLVDELLRTPMRYPTIVVRSTVPPGTTERIADRFEGVAEVLFAPEFLREGNALPDFLDPDRIIVGTGAAEVSSPYVELFEHLHKPTLVTSYTNAELIKSYANAFLAMKISFANEVANTCDAFAGADALAVLRGIGLDRRIGEAFLAPGIGFGGPCFEKDVKSLISMAGALKTGADLLAATLAVNDRQPRRIVDILESELGSLAGTRVGVWGLTFKAGTDDVRDSLAVRIVEDLLARGAAVVAHDPAVETLHGLPGCVVVPEALDATHADGLLVLTEWPQFRHVAAHEIAARLRRRVVVDGRNTLDSRAIADAGLHYRGVGRRGWDRMRLFDEAEATAS